MALDKKTRYEDQTTNLPEDILYHQILPRLPCKLLSRFKVTSKAYHALIAPNTYFATLQSLSPSPTSTGFVCVNGSSLSFLPDQDDIGVPDPLLEFMVKSLVQHAKLLASANGLLLFYLFGPVKSLCVCNPATKEKKILPKEEPEENIRREMGLVFNPRVSPDKYAVIDPLLETRREGIEYTFNIFSSQTGKWTCSKEKVLIPCSRNAPTRPVYALGLIYWSCIDYLLWFDPEKDRAGTIPLPYSYSSCARQEVEAFNDELACMCITSEGGIEVWRLIGGTKWNRLYKHSSNKLIHEISDAHCSGLPSDEVGKRCILTNFASPLAFDGKNMYLSVNMKEWCREKDLLLSNNGFVDEDILYFMDQIGEEDFYFGAESDANDDYKRNREEELLCCDMVTGKLINTGKSVIRTERNFRVFYYHNSMVAVPPISK